MTLEWTSTFNVKFKKKSKLKFNCDKNVKCAHLQGLHASARVHLHAFL